MLIALLGKRYPGMRLWLTQRLTAVVMAIYLSLLAILLIIQQPAGFDAWRGFVLPVWFRLATLLFFISLFSHAWLGVRDVLKDYIFNPALRSYLQIVVDIFLVIYSVWIVFILWNI